MPQLTHVIEGFPELSALASGWWVKGLGFRVYILRSKVQGFGFWLKSFRLKGSRRKSVHSAMPALLVGRPKTKTKTDKTTAAVGDEGCRA